MDAALYLNHPYGRPVIGWRHEIEQLDREDALAFYRRFYTPNNAILVIAGDVDGRRGPHAGRGDLRQGPARRRDQAARFVRRSRCSRRARTVTLADPRVTQPSVSRYYLVALELDGAPGRERGARRARAYPGPRLEQPALSDAGGGQGHRGERRRRATTAPRSTTRASSVYGTPKPGTSLPQLEQAIDAVLADVVENGRDRRGARTLQEPHDRRCHLCQ